METDAITTAPALLARASGRSCAGARRCAYCGAAASDPHAPPDSFTALDQLAAPRSGYRCAGCALAMTATAGQSPDGKPWMWAWVITGEKAERHALCPMLGGERVKAGRAAMRNACADPPGPPYVILLNESGRTHTLYRAAVHRGGAGATLTHDGRVLRYDPTELVARLALCARLAAAFGPKVIRDCSPISPGRWAESDLADLEEWHSVADEPLTAVAACLFDDPPKESE